ncbi:MAG TPA: hypothetical protein VFA98_15890 [Thermoanaerobaculia bacterium]|nr:hypothetical protein [Thermoanaerobaculia bacterium]
MTRNRLAVAVLAISTCAAVALGQNADKNTAGPTKNDYRLRVMEPIEGASISGPTVRVVVDTNVREQIGDNEKIDVNSMPRPLVDVWLDGTRRGTMKDAENVIEIDNVSPGPHKLALVAKNKANEIIDKKEINFTSSGSTVVEGANSSGTTPANPAPAETSTYRAPAPAPAPVTSDSSLAGPTTSSTYTPPSNSTYSSPQTSSSSSSMSTAENRTRPKMPATASNDGALLLAGGALLLGSYLIRLKA